MKRPHLVHFQCIMTELNINIRASLTMKENRLSQRNAALLDDSESKAPFPIQAYGLLSSDDFKIKIVCLSKDHQVVYKKTFESDSQGNFRFKIPLTKATSEIDAIEIYEIGKCQGLQLHLGTFLPFKLKPPKKLVICDFDKTLVETKYSTTKEVYNSLTKPLQYFPTLDHSVSLLKSYIKEGFHPFILSASPHFYEDSIRDWLYKNQIFTAAIFLKDYRKVLSIFDSELSPKDLKVQGLYKLNHLLDILLMTGIPSELILMGDNFESDPIIYLTLAMVLNGDYDPWHIWNTLKENDSFLLSKKQNMKFLNKIYQLDNLIGTHRKVNGTSKLKIMIRKKAREEEIKVPEFFRKRYDLIELYDGNGPKMIEGANNTI